MKLHCLGSSSKGNSYLLIGETSVLMIEAGVSLKAVKKSLEFDLRNICGCIVSHEHGDHAGFVSEYLNAGIRCYSSRGTITATGIDRHNFIALEEKKKYQIGEFQVMPFPVKHDCKQPFGYLIKHNECGLCCFITDTHYVPFKFPGMNQILIEANFSEKIIDEKTTWGKMNPLVRARTIENHMSIENCIIALKNNDLSEVNNLVLIHLSDGNSNAKEFQKEIQDMTGKRVYVADKEITIDFNKEGF